MMFDFFSWVPGRTFFLQILTFIAQAVLWAYLGAAEWGIFLILNAVINIFNYFSNIGLAAALVQKKESPTETDLKTTFLVQEIVVFMIVVVIFLLSPVFINKYSLSGDGVGLLYALTLSFLLSSFKSIPSVLLERKLEFVKLTFPQIVEQVIYYVVLVGLAMRGFGIVSFTVAIITRDVVGLIVLYWLQPWRPGIAFSRKVLAGLFKFGVPYQVNTLLAAIKDDGMTVVLGGILGSVGVGFLGMAEKIARWPLAFFMDTVTKVTFPAFSRMQDNRDQLARSVTRSIFFICFLVFPSLAGLVVLAPIVLVAVPKYSQWTPALVAISLVSVKFAFAAATTQLTNLLNAIGKIRITFYLMVMWTLLTWITVPFLAARGGFNGAALGSCLVGISSVVAIVVTKRYVNFSVLDAMVKPALGAILMGGVLLVLRGLFEPTIYTITLLVVVGSVVYGALMVAIIGVSLINDAKRSFKTILAR